MVTRRRFLTGSASGFAVALGMAVPFEKFLPDGVVPVALAQDFDPDYTDDSLIAAKDGLTVLGDRPINMETPPHLLDDLITPASRLFVRNNGQVPFAEDLNTENWRLVVDGEVETPLSLSIADLQQRFETVTRQMVLECGGNGRRFYTPGASGNQWTFGAVGCPQWTGVRLRDVLQAAGIKDTAVYTGHYGVDMHLSGDPAKDAISRGVPIEKALEDGAMIAWGMNGAALPVLNGYPLRLVIPGLPASCSQKWLNRIWVRDRVHDGAKMGGTAYRVPAYPVAPGTKVAGEDMKIIDHMPVKSLITSPQTGNRVSPGDDIEIRGHAWAGDKAVQAVHVSTDFGATWQQTVLKAPANTHAWQHWEYALKVPATAGYYEIWGAGHGYGRRHAACDNAGVEPKRVSE